jgi:hypothetical protein
MEEARVQLSSQWERKRSAMIPALATRAGTVSTGR